ncbi:MAG TPA: branched-chain amino acid ABC transporter permease [Acidimicrobiales bacterium]|nr:branched-chain amino acid ABC transporter permease [Acidimicrobiales bacterium]
MHAVMASVGGSIGVPIANGLVNGCLWGLLAIGIVLIYKANGIFNFAQGEFGSMAALIAVSAVDGLGPFPKLPLPVAMVLGLIAGTACGLLTERLVIRPLFRAPRATLLVATAGVALFFASIQALCTGTDLSHVFPALGGHSRFALFGSVNSPDAYVFGWTQITRVLVLVAVAALAVVFFRTRYGLGILAVSQDPVAANTVGINVNRISMLTWSLAGLLGAAAGLIDVPGGPYQPGLVSGILTGVGPLVFAFIGAVLGGMTSLPGAFVGSLALGLIDSFGGRYMPTSVPGGDALVIFGTLLVVLLFRPTGLLGRET